MVVKGHHFPNVTLVGNAKTFAMLPQFFDIELEGKTLTVKEGDSLSLGEHELTFVMAPMVHWPEVMVTYDKKDIAKLTEGHFLLAVFQAEFPDIGTGNKFILIVGFYDIYYQKDNKTDKAQKSNRSKPTHAIIPTFRSSLNSILSIG